MNVMKKRTLALMLSAALCVGLLAGCGSGNNDPVNTPAAGGSETPLTGIHRSPERHRQHQRLHLHGERDGLPDRGL